MIRFDKVEYQTRVERGSFDPPHFLSMRFHFRAGRTLYVVCSWPEFCLRFAGYNHWYPGIVWVNGVVLNGQKYLLKVLRLALLDFLEREPCLTRHPAHDARERRALLVLGDRLEEATTIRCVRKEKATTPSRFATWRGNLWKLKFPDVRHIHDVFHTAVYADGGSINVKFLVGTRAHSLWVRADRFREHRGYIYQYIGHIYLNGWQLDGRVKTLENLIVAIHDYLDRDLDEEAHHQEEAYFREQVHPKSERGNQRVELRFVLDDLERAKRPGCIRKQKAFTKAEREAEFERLRASFGTDCSEGNDAS